MAPPTAARKLLGKILEDMKVVSAIQIKTALKKQMTESGKKLGEILIEMNAANSGQITKALARQFDYPCVDLKNLKSNPDVTKAIPRSVCEENKIFPIKYNGRNLTIAMHDPLDLFALDNLKFILNMEIDIVLAPKDTIEGAIERYYGNKEKSMMSETIEQATMTQSEIKVPNTEMDG